VPRLRLPLTAFFFFLLGLSTWSSLRWSSQQKQMFSRGQMELLKALHFSQTINSQVTNSLMTDKTLAQNVTWRLIHSVQGTLSARLQEPFVEDITIWASECKIIAKVGTIPSGDLPCPEVELKKKEFSASTSRQDQTYRRSFWHQTQNNLIYITAAKLPLLSDGAWMMVGMRFQEDWTRQFPDLAKILARYHYRISVDPGTGSAPVESDLTLRLPSGVRGRYLDFLFDDRIQFYAERLSGFFWFMAFILIVVWVILLHKYQKNLHRHLASTHESMLGTISSLAQDTEFASPEFRSEFLNGYLEQFSEHKESVTLSLNLQKDAFEKLIQIIKRLDSDFKYDKKNMEEDNRRLINDNQMMEGQIANTRGIVLLHSQQCRLIGAISHLFGDFELHLDDLLTTLEAGYLSAKAQHSNLNLWQQMIAQKGARKFIRSLSETPGQNEGKTALDDQVGFLIHQAEVQKTMAIGSQKIGRLMASWFEVAQSLALFWEDFIKNRPSQHLGDQLSDWVLLAQKWAQLSGVAGNSEEIFVNNLGAQVPIQPSSKTSWILFLVHIYSYFLEELDEGPFKILTTSKNDGRTQCLLVQIVCESRASSVAGAGALLSSPTSILPISFAPSTPENRTKSREKHGDFLEPQVQVSTSLNLLRDDFKALQSMMSQHGINVLPIPFQPGNGGELGYSIVCTWEAEDDKLMSSTSPRSQSIVPKGAGVVI
jgi:hypothetical protein